MRSLSSGIDLVAEFLVEALIVVAVGSVGWSGLVYLDVFTPQDVRAWRRLARLRGYAQRRSAVEKLATRAPLLHRVQSELDLTRLLGIANRAETPLGFLARALGYGLAGGTVFLVFDGLARAATGDWVLGLAPVWFIPIWLTITVLCVVRLRSAVRRRQAHANRALGDMLMLVAILTDGRGLQLADAVRILSRCVDDDTLEAIVDRQGFLRLIHQPQRSTVALYRAIGEQYGISMFTRLSDAAANTNVGFAERDVYTRLAKAVYQQRLAEARVRAARAKTLVTIPVAGMLVPLLILLGAPAISSLAGALR
ncbi:MAG: hypothetical protein NVSMB29_00680 [Candidatus Dormibacteria bacterium]